MGTGRLGELREAMELYSARFDPALISVADATAAVDDAAAIEKMAATVKALAAGRAAESGQWRRRGARSPAHDLAQRTGTSVGAAVDALDAAKALEALPVLAGAAKRGEVSPQQLAAIADAAGADPSAERRLVESSRHSSLAELRDECARIKAAARPQQAEAEHAEVHRTRYLRTFRDRQGGWNLSVRNVPEVGAEFMAMLRPLQDRVFRRARAENRRESFEAYGADALADMVRQAASASSSGAAGRGARGPDLAGAGAGDEGEDRPDERADPAAGRRSAVPVKIIARVDWDSLVRGFPAEGEICEIAGIGPVPVSVVRGMLATGDPFLAAVVTKGVDVVNVAHLGRRATAHQVSALEWRDPECPALGCNNTAYLEIDHTEDWASTRITLLGLLGRPCTHHHDLKTRHGWAFVPGVGKRPMVPPGDPRHPKYGARAGPSQPQPGREPEAGPAPEAHGTQPAAEPDVPDARPSRAA